MLGTPGNELLNCDGCFNGGTALQHSSIVDKHYMVVGAHIEQSLRDKIKHGEYVDFTQLLPRDCILHDENRLELVNRDGHTDHNGVVISSFNKWEQAFRVYFDIYSCEHPDRSAELIQYNHIIFTTSLTYTWDNVYTYDREFRMHLGQYPKRSWAIILQQAWSMCLKDRVQNSNNLGKGGFKQKKEPCRRFNKGICTAGKSCKYDHRCTVPKCGKFGHGAHICRLRDNGPTMMATTPTSSTTTGQK